MGVTNFQSVVSAQTVGTADIDKLAQSFDKLSGSIDKAADGANKVSNHPGFDDFAAKVKAGIQDPFAAAGDAIEGLLGKLGPTGTAVAGGIGIFTGIEAGAFAAAKALGAYATGIENVSIRTGLSVKEVGQFSFAAKVAGQDVGVFESAMRMLSQGLEDNSAKGQKARQGLKDLGVSAYDATGQLRPMSDIFLQVSDGLSKITDPAKRDAEALAVFGRAGIEILPTMVGLTGHLAKAKELGFGPTDAEVQRWKGYQEQIVIVESEFAKLRRQLEEPFAAIFSLTVKGATALLSSGADSGGLRLGPGGQLITSNTSRYNAVGDQISGGGAPLGSGALGFPLLSGGRQMSEYQHLTSGANAPSLFSPLMDSVIGQLTPPNTGLATRVTGALAPLDGQKDATEAKRRLEELQAELQRMVDLGAPDSQKSAKADEVLQQKQKVTGIEAEIKAAQQLAEEKRRLLDLDKQSQVAYDKAVYGGSGDFGRIYGDRAALKVNMDDDLRKAGNDPSSRANVQGAYGNFFEANTLELNTALQKWKREVDSIAESAPTLRPMLPSMATPGKMVTPEEYSRETGGFIADNPWIFAGGSVPPPPGYTSPQDQLRNARDTERRGLGLYGAQASLAGTSQTDQVEGQYTLRLQLAQQVYAAELRNADLEETEAQKQTARSVALADGNQKLYDAQTERLQSLLQLANQQKEGFQSMATGAFSALLGGARSREGAGAAFDKWGESQLTSLATKIVGNGAGMLWNSGLSKIVPHVGDGKLLGGLLQGTGFGPDPMKQATADNTIATIDNTTALRSMALGGSGASGGGGFIPGFGGVGGNGPSSYLDWATGSSTPGFASPSPNDIVTTSPDGPLGTINWGSINPLTTPSTAGPSFNLGNGLGIGTALAAGGMGIYSGIKAGGAQGDLEAAGSGIGMLGGIASQLGSISATLSTTLGPIGMGIGAALGIASLFLGNPKQNRVDAETATAVAARYTAPTPTNYIMDQYGQADSMTMNGGFQPIQVQMTVQTMDSNSFNDNASNIANSLSTAIEGNISPRLSMALRSAVTPN